MKILQEKVYPLDAVVSEPETEETINSLGMTLDKVKEAANSVVSISVSALKK